MLEDSYRTTTHLLTSDDESCGSWESDSEAEYAMGQVEDTHFMYTAAGDCYYDSSMDPDYCPTEDELST